MSKNYDDTNKGAIWINDKKEKPTQPDYRGQLNVNGVEYWVSGWRRKEGENPKAPAVRFRVESKADAAARYHGGSAQNTQNAHNNSGNQGNRGNQGGDNFDDFDDDIPF